MTSLSLPLTALTVAALALSALTASPAVASGDDDAVAAQRVVQRRDRVEDQGEGGRRPDRGRGRDRQQQGRAELVWKFKDNGSVFATGTSTTTGPSGSFEVERKPANRAGTDNFVFRAVHPKSGEVCRATVSW